MRRIGRLSEAFSETWERVVRHPFVLALGDGTLPRRAFAAYMAQDYLFVDALARTVAHLLVLSLPQSSIQFHR